MQFGDISKDVFERSRCLLYFIPPFEIISESVKSDVTQCIIIVPKFLSKIKLYINLCLKP